MRRRIRTSLVAALVALGATAMTGCAGTPSASPAAASGRPPAATTGSTPHDGATEPVADASSLGRTRGRAVTKVLVIVEENHSLTQMRSGMPYLYAQATRFGYATHYTAATHPSLPNYLAIGLGSTFGIHDDNVPRAHPEPGPSVFGAALAVHRTAKSYQESMPSTCAGYLAGAYAPKHNPWAYAASERSSCGRLDVPSGTASAGSLHDDIAKGALPTVGLVTPNLDHDAHDGSLSTADSWLRGWLTRIYAGPDWRAGRLAVVVTADEDDRASGNTVLTAVLHPSQHHHVVGTALTHYSLSRLLTAVAGAPCIRGGCSAPSLAAAFGLPLRGHS